MSEKPSKPSRMAPLQKLTVRPIDDPAEQTALDRKLAQGEAAPAVRTRGGTRATASQVLEQAARLPADARVQVVTQLAAELSPEQRLELVVRLAGQLSADALGRLEEWLRQRPPTR